jgi:hypothetical protein
MRPLLARSISLDGTPICLPFYSTYLFAFYTPRHVVLHTVHLGRNVNLHLTGFNMHEPKQSKGLIIQ